MSTGDQLSSVPFNANGNGFNATADTVTKLGLSSVARLGVNQPLVLSNGGTVSQGNGTAYFNIFYRVLNVGSSF